MKNLHPSVTSIPNMGQDLFPKYLTNLKIYEKNNNNNNKYRHFTQPKASYSLQHILQRRYYLAIAQMASTRKTYIPCLLGIIIKLCHMINMKEGVNTSTVVTKE